jgi:hypothetical protein
MGKKYGGPGKAEPTRLKLFTFGEKLLRSRKNKLSGKALVTNAQIETFLLAWKNGDFKNPILTKSRGICQSIYLKWLRFKTVAHFFFKRKSNNFIKSRRFLKCQWKDGKWLRLRPKKKMKEVFIQ